MEQNKPDSIFSRILPALKKSSKIQGDDINNKEIIAGANLNNQTGGVQQLQQDYLNLQSHKVAYDISQKSFFYDSDRPSAYLDFRAMDMSPEVSAAMDIIADEAVTKNERGNILSIYSENSRVKKILKDLFENRLNINYNLGLWIREMVKYGDNFVKLEIDQKEGIYDATQMRVNEMYREESFDNQINSARFKWQGTQTIYFEEWQMAHFRLVSDGSKLPYGRSILEPARKLWKQLQLAEDAMLVYRLVRAPERRVYYIEVGNIDPNDVPQHMENIKKEIKKQPVVNQSSGNVNFKFNPISLEEDFFLPIRGDKGSRIETLAGAANMNDILDVEYLQNKLFAALKVPKTYLNYSESMPGGSTLSQADLRFSRTINRIQESVIIELRRIANIHLYLLGFEDDLNNFSLSLTNPSSQQELLKLETMKTRMEVFNLMYTSDVTSPVSYTWAMENILGFSHAEIKQILRQKKIERKIFNEIEGATETYKDSGMFKDLDVKFKKPESEIGDSNGEDTSDSSEEVSGLTDIGSEPEMDIPNLGTESELAAEPESTEQTVAENNLLKHNNKNNRKLKNLLENIDKHIEDLNNKKII